MPGQLYVILTTESAVANTMTRNMQKMTVFLRARLWTSRCEIFLRLLGRWDSKRTKARAEDRTRVTRAEEISVTRIMQDVKPRSSPDGSREHLGAKDKFRIYSWISIFIL